MTDLDESVTAVKQCFSVNEKLAGDFSDISTTLSMLCVTTDLRSLSASP